MLDRHKTFVILASLWGAVAVAEDMPEKAERYRTMLLRKPESAVLFNRMLDAWLEERDLAGLREELERRARDGGAADWRLLAVFHEHAGKDALAIEALDAAVERAPEDAATRLARGKALGRALRFEAALDDLARAVDDPATSLEAGTLRGKLLARAGRPEEAVKAWQELIADHPQDEGLREDLIELEIGEGMLDEAVEAARELADSTDDPYQKALRRMRVAEILAQAGRKEDSLGGYREVFAVSAAGSWLEREVLARVAALFTREDDLSGLSTYLSELREEYPRRVAVKKEAAKAMLAAGEEDEAIAMFREVIKVLPGEREVREEFIALLEGAGRLEDAAREVEALLASAPRDAVLWERLAGLCKAAGDEPGAVEALDKALALLAEDEQGQVARARLLDRFERRDEAEQLLREAVAKHGSRGEAGEALAGLLVALDRGDEALELWKEMAAGADREGLLRIARSMSAHGKAPAAYALLEPRLKDFEGDALLLAAACRAAQLSDEAGSAVPYSFELVRLAESPTDLDAALRLATGLIARSKTPRKWLEELSGVEAPSIQERCLLAELHEGMGDSIAAERVLRAAMDGEDALMAAAQRVRLLEMRGDIEGASAAQRELMAMPGGMRTAQVKRLVELLERAADLEGALEETGTWLRLAPGDKLAWTKRADLLLVDGRPADAVAELRRALAKFGDDEAMRAKLGQAQQEAGMVEEAWRSFTGLYDESESSTGKLRWVGELARMAAMEGREESLVRDFRRRSQENPSSILPLLALADMYREWQMPEDELDCVAEASRRRPEDARLKFRMADLYEDAGSTDAAAGVLRSLVGGVEGPEARRRMAAMWIRQGETERGLRELMATGEGGDARTVEKVAMALVDSKEWEMAAGFLGREVGGHPGDWRLGHLHAVCLAESGRVDEAIDALGPLLEAEGELEGLTALNSQSNYYTYGRFGLPTPGREQKVSREAIPMLNGYRQRAISHRNEQDPWSGRRGGGVSLPGTPDEARRLAMGLMVELAGDDEGRRETVRSRLVSGHFDDLAILRASVFLEDEEIVSRLQADDAPAELFKWWMSTSGRRGNDETARGIAWHGARRFREEDPELALRLSQRLPLSGEEPPGPEVARLMLGLFDALEAKQRETFIGVLRSVAFAGDDLPEELRAEAEERLLDEVEKLADDPAKSWQVGNLAERLYRAGRYEAAVQWINRLETIQQEAGGARNNLRAWNQSRHSLAAQWGSSEREPGIEQRLQEEEPRIWNMVRGRNRGRAYTEDLRRLMKILGEAESSGDSGGEPDLAAAAAAAEQLADRLQRVCFFKAAEREQDLLRELEGIEEDEGATAGELLVAAAHWSEDEPERAYELLRRSRQAVGAAERRDRIDFELATVGVRLKDGEADLEPARRAALRMRRSVSGNTQMQRQLAEVMTSLGLEDEAKRLASAPSGRARFGSRSLGTPFLRPSGSAAMSDPRSQISKLARDGKRDAAARKLLASLRQSTGHPNQDYLRRQVMESVKAFRLQDDLIKHAKPAEGAGWKRRLEYARLLIEFDHKDEALPVLKELATERPDDAIVRTALYSVLPEDERGDYLESLAGGDFDADALAAFFSSWMEYDDESRRHDAMQAITGFLEVLEPSFDSGRNLSWVNYFVKNYVTQDHPGSVRMRSLTEPQEGGEGFHEEATKRRVELCRKLFAAMLRHPQTANQGFVMLHVTRKGLGTPVEAIDEAAVLACRLELRSEPPPANRRHYNSEQMLWAWFSNGGSSRSGGSPSGQILPMPYLAERASEGVKLDPYDEAFLAELAASDPGTAEMLERCERLVGEDGDGALKAWIEKASGRAAEAARELPWIELLARRAGRDDLLVLLEKEVVAAMIDGRSWLPGGADILVQRVKDETGFESRTATLRRLTVHLLGPEEGWPLYQGIDNYYVQGISNRFNHYGSLLRGLSGDASLEVVGYRFTVGAGVPASRYLSMNRLQQALRNAEEAKVLLDLGVLLPGPEPVLVPEASGRMRLLDLVVRESRNDEARKKLGESLAEVEGPERFWARVLAGTLLREPELVRAELEGGLDRIRAWPDRARSDLAGFLDGQVGRDVVRPDSALGRLLEESRKQDLAASREWAEGILKDGPPNELNFHSVEVIREPLENLISLDAGLAARVWDRCLRHFRLNTSGWSGSSGGFPNTAMGYAHREMQENVLRNKVSLVSYGRFLVALSGTESGAWLGPGENDLSYRLREIVTQEIEIRKDAIGSVKSTAELPRSYKELAALLELEAGEGEPEDRIGLAVLLGHFFARQHWGSTREAREKLVPWADEHLRPLDPVLADVVIVGVCKHDVGGLDDAGRGRLREAFASFAGNPRIPAMLRFDAVAQLARDNDAFARALDDPRCAGAMTELLKAYLNPDREWATYRSVPMLVQVTRWKGFSEDDASALFELFGECRPLVAGNQNGNAAEQLGAIEVALALRTGDPELMAKAVRTGAGMRGRIDLAIELWQVGQDEAARSLVARPGELHAGMGPYWMGRSSEPVRFPAFSRELESALPGWLAGVGDPQVRYRIECLVASLKDASGDAAPEVTRDERLAALISRFEAEAPKARVARMECLGALMSAGAVVSPLEGALGEVLRGSDLGTVMISDATRYGGGGQPMPQEQRDLLELLSRQACLLALERGDASVLAAQVEAVMELSGGNNRWPARQLMEGFFDAQAALLVRKTVEAEGEAGERLAAQALELCRSLLGFEENEMHRRSIALAISTQAAAGDGSAMDRWLEELQPLLRERYEEARKQTNLQNAFRTLHQPALMDEPHEASRRKLLVALLSDPATLEREIVHPTEISTLMDSGTFTLEDAVAAIDSLPDEHPRKARFVAEKAGIIAWRTNEFEPALEAYDEAERLARESGDEHDLAYVQFYRAACYNDKMGRQKEARGLVDSIDEALLGERELDWRKRIIEQNGG